MYPKYWNMFSWHLQHDILGPLGPGGPTGPHIREKLGIQLVGRYWVYKHPPKKWDFDPPKMAIFLLPGTFSGVYSDPLVVLNRIFGAPTPWNTPHSVVFSPRRADFLEKIWFLRNNIYPATPWKTGDFCLFQLCVCSAEFPGLVKVVPPIPLCGLEKSNKDKILRQPGGVLW